MRLNAKELRKLKMGARFRSPRGEAGGNDRKKKDIYIILDNVLDTYNIGSIFRLADAVAAKKIYLCGETETPPNHRIKKASINTTEVVDWEYCGTAVEAINKIREEFSLRSNSILRGAKRREVQIVAIEQAIGSVPYDKFDLKTPVALIVGHESNGVSKEALSMADAILEIPMFGVNKSLNVMVSLSVVLYKVISNDKAF